MENKEKIIIREMKEEDLDKAIALWRISFKAGFSSAFDTKENMIKYLNRNPGFSSVAYTENKDLVGALMCGHDGRRGSIYNTAVDVNYRHQGIGKMMEQRSLLELKKIGIKSGFLFINIKNPGSLDFWKSIGWEVIEDVRYLYKQF